MLMALPKFLTTVTPFSKLLSGAIFITLPILGFVLGSSYQADLDTVEQSLFLQQVSARTISAPALAPAKKPPTKTYRNPAYGYAFNYPAELTHKVEIQKGTDPNAPFYQEVFYKNNDALRIIVQKSASLEQTAIKTELAKMSLALDDFQTRTLGGQKAVYYRVTNEKDKAGSLEVRLNYGGRQILIKTEGPNQTGYLSAVLDNLVFSTGLTDGPYTCPDAEWVNCMPLAAGDKPAMCQQAFLSWAKNNCPGFKGAAY